MRGILSIIRFSGGDLTSEGDYGVYRDGHTMIQRGSWFRIARHRKTATEQGSTLPSPPWEPCRQGKVNA